MEEITMTGPRGPIPAADTDSVSWQQQGQQRVADAKQRAEAGLDQATSALGRQMERIGDAVQNATVTATGPIQRAGRYMQASDPETIGQDFVGLMRNNPKTTFFVGMGMGFVVARLLPLR